MNIRSLRSIAKIAGTILCVGGAIVMALLRGPKLLNNSKEHLILLGSMFGYGSGGGGDDGDGWIIGCLFLFGSCCCWSIWLILQVIIDDPCRQISLTFQMHNEHVIFRRFLRDKYVK